MYLRNHVHEKIIQPSILDALIIHLCIIYLLTLMYLG